MKRRTLFGLSSLSAAIVLALVLVFSAGTGGQSAPQPALTRVTQTRHAGSGMNSPAQTATITTTTKYLPVLFGPPAVEMHTVVPHDGARFDSGGETWEAAKAGADLYLSEPYGAKLLAKEQAPYGSLAIYAFSRSIAYFDTSDIADRAVAGDAGTLTLTYYNENTRQPLDLSVGLLFRRAPASPATEEMWHQFEDWPLLASQPVTTSVNVMRALTLDTSQFVEDDGTLPETLAIGIQTTEPRLAHGQSIYSKFPLARMSLMIPMRPEERSRER